MSRASTLSLPTHSAALWSTAALLRTLLLSGCLLSVLAALYVGNPAAYLQSDPALAHLLRGMAVIKAGMVSGALGVLLWRFGRPVPRTIAVGYLAGSWLIAGATAMIWQLSHIGAAAGGFHVGEIGMLVLAWREHRAEWPPRVAGVARNVRLKGV